MRVRSRALAAITLVAQAACMTGPRRVKGVTPAEYLEANSPPRVWATLADGERIVIEGPRVISDTVFGWTEGEEFVVPASDLQEIEVQKLSIFRSSIGPALVLAGTIAAVAILKKNISETHDPDLDSTIDNVRQLQ